MRDREGSRDGAPPERGSHARDLRLAGGASAGLVSAILVAGALVAPIADRNGEPNPEQSGEVLTVRLPRPPSAAARGHERDKPSAARAPAGSEAAPAIATIAIPAVVPLRAQPGARELGTARPAPADVRGLGSGSTTASDSAIVDPAANTLAADTDGDGIPDQRWQAYGLPADTRASADQDGDGIINADELDIKTAPNTRYTTAGIADAELDADGDGLRNGLEAGAGTKPSSDDSDADGVTDGQADADGDGLTNQTEQAVGTNLALGDSDGDGVSDAATDSDGDGYGNAVEVAAGSLPASAGSIPAPEPAPSEDPRTDRPARPPDGDEPPGFDPGTPPDDDDSQGDDTGAPPSGPAEEPEGGPQATSPEAPAPVPAPAPVAAPVASPEVPDGEGPAATSEEPPAETAAEPPAP